MLPAAQSFLYYRLQVRSSSLLLMFHSIRLHTGLLVASTIINFSFVFCFWLTFILVTNWQLQSFWCCISHVACTLLCEPSSSPWLLVYNLGESSGCCTPIPVYPISSPSIFASKFVQENFSFLFLPNKRTFELKTLQINITQVLPCAEKFSHFLAQHKFLKMIQFIQNFKFDKFMFHKKNRKHFIQWVTLVYSWSAKFQGQMFSCLEETKKRNFYIRIARILTQTEWSR